MAKSDEIIDEENTWILRNKGMVRLAILLVALMISLTIGAILVLKRDDDSSQAPSQKSIFTPEFASGPTLSPVATDPVPESPPVSETPVTESPVQTPVEKPVQAPVEPPVEPPSEQQPVETETPVQVDATEAPVKSPGTEPNHIVETTPPLTLAPTTTTTTVETTPVDTTATPTLQPTTSTPTSSPSAVPPPPTLAPSTVPPPPTLSPSTSSPTLTPTIPIVVECRTEQDCNDFGGTCNDQNTCVSADGDSGTPCRGPLDCASQRCGLEEYKEGAMDVCCPGNNDNGNNDNGNGNDSALLLPIPWLKQDDETSSNNAPLSAWVCSSLQPGQACAQDEQCASQVCVEGICQEQILANGEVCDSDLDCAERRCGLQDYSAEASLVCCNGGDALLLDLPWLDDDEENARKAQYVCSQLDNGAACYDDRSCASRVCEEASSVCVADECPSDPAKHLPGICGCGVADTDSDGDGVPDCDDVCPSDPLKSENAGICGCGVSDTEDPDGDGVPTCVDLCPQDKDKVEPGICGCGSADVDSDGDGTLDCLDVCPEDALKTVTAGECGCGVAEIDSDSDGVLDCLDSCPDDAEKTEAGVCGCGVTTCSCTADIADIDSDGDGVPDCDDSCPGTIGGNVDRNGCVPLVCSFNLLGHYLGKSPDNDRIIGVDKEATWELVHCLDHEIYDCKAIGGRCMSLRMHDDDSVYLRHVDMWMWVGEEGSSGFCQDASFCLLRGMEESDGSYSDPNTVTLKSMSVPDRQVHVGAEGIGPALLHYGGEYVKWNFDCDGEDPVTSTHGLARPDDISCSRRQLRHRQQ